MDKNDLRIALAKAISEADSWYDECRGDGLAPNLDKERKLLRENRGNTFMDGDVTKCST